MNAAARLARPDGDGTVISKQILTEAATWLMELHDGPLSQRQRAQFDEWRQRSAEHALAWEKAAALMGKFDALPPSGAIALKTMSTRERRGAVKLAAALLVAGPIGWMPTATLRGPTPAPSARRPANAATLCSTTAPG